MTIALLPAPQCSKPAFNPGETLTGLISGDNSKETHIMPRFPSTDGHQMGMTAPVIPGRATSVYSWGSAHRSDPDSQPRKITTIFSHYHHMSNQAEDFFNKKRKLSDTSAPIQALNQPSQPDHHQSFA